MMHIRPKPWARPELEACPYFQTKPTLYCGQWQHNFPKKQPLHIELGCGKGSFMAELASQNLHINYLAIDLIDAVLGSARRNIQAAFDRKQIAVDNLQLMSWNIERIDQIISPKDQVKRIYINFCNPWPRRRQQKRRLTHPRQLSQYREFMAKDGEIHFKTDNDGLFRDSINYLKECGFTIKTILPDLHAADYQANIETEHEKMYHQQGIAIKFLIATL